MNSYPVFEASRDEPGATVVRFRLSSGTEIDAIVIGETGRGREQGVLPVGGIVRRPEPCPGRGGYLYATLGTGIRKCDRCGAVADDTGCHPQSGEWISPTIMIMAAEVGTSQSGRPKLIARSSATTDDVAIVVIRAGMGFRGGNEITGDRTGEVRRASWGNGDSPVFAPFPGQVLARGVIAQGDAGRMGSGEQVIAIIPRGVVFRVGMSGRLYGGPSAHYYVFDGERIRHTTWEDRVAADGADGFPIVTATIPARGVPIESIPPEWIGKEVRVKDVTGEYLRFTGILTQVAPAWDVRWRIARFAGGPMDEECSVSGCLPSGSGQATVDLL